MAVITESRGRLIFGVAIDGAGTVFGSVDTGNSWHAIGEIDGGFGSELPSTGADQIYWSINDLVPIGNSLVAVGRTNSWSSTEDLGGRCYWDENVWCRTDAALWIGNWIDQ